MNGGTLSFYFLLGALACFTAFAVWVAKMGSEDSGKQAKDKDSLK